MVMMMAVMGGCSGYLWQEEQTKATQGGIDRPREPPCIRRQEHKYGAPRHGGLDSSLARYMTHVLGGLLVTTRRVHSREGFQHRDRGGSSRVRPRVDLREGPIEAHLGRALQGHRLVRYLGASLGRA